MWEYIVEVTLSVDDTAIVGNDSVAFDELSEAMHHIKNSMLDGAIKCVITYEKF